MSSDVAIQVDELSKRFVLHGPAPAARLFEHLAARFRPRKERRRQSEVWALRDVSASVKVGEVVGLIGRNGSGKSTLLKVLSRITVPTRGRAEIHGRVGSLLEVGTGFHPELTGRENCYLNGAILGMSRAEVSGRMDEIVEFAELDRFMDTPVKRYSSGMYMRLAFSVVAFLESEILLVDEVLAVGDLAFQRRCLAKMNELSGSGRTVVFVSHNLGAVAQLCDTGLWLDRGKVMADGDVDSVLAAYTRSVAGEAPTGASWSTAPTGASPVEFIAAAVLAGQAPTTAISCDEEVVLSISVRVNRPEPGASVAFLLRNSQGVVVVSSDITHADAANSDRLTVGDHRFSISLPPRLLAPDQYTLTLIARAPYSGELADHEDVCQVEIVELSTAAGGRRAGVVGLNLPWVERDTGTS